MQTVQDPCHAPISQFLPEYGELTNIHGSMVEVEFSENRRRFDLTTKSVIGTPITTLCTISKVRRSATNGEWVADVTGTTAEGKIQVPTREMCMKTILAARGNPTGRSWAFLGFKVPSGGEQIINHQLSSLLASRPQLTGTEYSSCQLAAPTRKSWICVGSRFYRPISNDGTAPDHDAWLSRPAPPPIRKRGISKISTPVIPLDLRTPAPVLTTDSGSKTPGQATFAPEKFLGLFFTLEFNIMVLSPK